jgi:CHAD domain-containing protein
MFRFEPKGAGVEEQFRQIAADQITRALDELEGGARDIGETIHKVRRSSKKLRGLLQLVRPVFEAFAKENAAIRDAAATLAHARDADVTLQTLDQLAEIRPDDGPPLQRIRERLAGRRQAAAEPAMLERFHAAFRDLRERAKTWSLEDSGWDALGPGLERTYRTARRRMKRAIASGTATDHHEWRKSNKHHGYHIDLLDDLADDVLAHELKANERLSEQLGRHHDLEVLKQRMTQDPDTFGPEDDRGVLSRAIRDETAKLEDSARTLGRQLYAEEPAALLERYTAYWRMHED